ncbi:MAG: hypothetical protein ACLS36_05115 [Streptococcus sp.]
MFRILKFDDDFVYLSHPDGRLKKIDRKLFDFDIKLGDRIDVYQDGDLTVVTPAEVQTDLSLEGDKSVKSHLLQGILDLFLETLNIHNNHLGDLKKIFTQLLITLFMAWSLLGVILVEILLFAESIIVFLWRLLVRLIKWMHIKDNTKVLIDETQKRHAKRERQKLKTEQERRRQEELEEREYLRETERQKELMIVEASLSQEAERESLSTSLALEQAGASSQSASEDLAEESSQLQSQK